MANRRRRMLQGTLLGVLCFGLSAPSQAQVNAFTEANSLQARATITIPFGGDKKTAKSQPQFALGLRSETARPNISDWALRPSFDVVDVREFKLALTLDDTPSVLLNNQILTFDDELFAKPGQAGALDNYDKTVLTVIGVSLAVIAGSIIILSDG